MITIGMLLRDELSDLSFNDKAVNIDFGTQKALVEWIKDKDKNSQKKYPLLWLVIDSYDDIGTQYMARVRFILFYQTKQYFKNKDRFELVYSKTLNPLFEILKTKLIRSKNIYLSDMPTRVFKNIVDADNYGVNFDNNRLNKQENDFSRESTKQNKSIAQDFLDAKYIDLTIKINKKLC